MTEQHLQNHARSIQQVPEVGLVSIYRFLEQHDVRIVVRPDQTVWFVAADVCAALGLGNPTMAVQRLDEEERMTLNSIEGHAGLRGGAQSHNLISESGMYNMVLTSRKPEAKPFKDWVTKEVLPAIRRQGFYFAGSPMTKDRLSMVKLARQLTLDVAKSRDHFSRLMLRSLLMEVSTALGQTLPHDPELEALMRESEFKAKQAALPGV